MRTASTDRDDEQLGMTVGIASYLLKKQMLWRFMPDEMKNCLRCGERLTVEDFTLDHKVPWRGMDTDRFWDLDNIGYSHHRCNSSAGRPTKKKVGPEGTAWCGQHQEFFPIECFHRNRRNWNGVHRECKECRKK